MGGFITDYFSATVASVDDDIALFGVGLGADGTENSAAGVRSVAGVDVNVERAETEGAMVSRGVAERQNLAAAVFADEALVQLFEAFIFHFVRSFHDEIFWRTD